MAVSCMAWARSRASARARLEAITEARQDRSLQRICSISVHEVDLKRINKRTSIGLIRSGALDRLGPYFHDEPKAYQASIDQNRAVLLAAWRRSRRRTNGAYPPTAAMPTCLAGCLSGEDADVYANHRKAKATLKERLRGSWACT